jgi:Leucine-rich repeat (LRR) protein
MLSEPALKKPRRFRAIGVRKHKSRFSEAMLFDMAEGVTRHIYECVSEPMKNTLRNECVTILCLICLAATSSYGQSTQTNIVEFPDKNLEAAVRKFIFEKRDNDKPLVESELVNLSTIQGVGRGITNLSGLEKCENLASLDLSKNKISNLGPIKGLTKIQYLNMANNQIEDVSPLSGIMALQYIELSNNRVKDIRPLGSLTNMASLYLSQNQISDISPVLNMRKLASLYLDGNKIKSIQGLGTLGGLSSLSLKNNSIRDISPLVGLNGLYYLFLEGNRIGDLTPLVEMARKDTEGERRFAPYLNLYLKGNPVKRSQVTKLESYGVRVNR